MKVCLFQNKSIVNVVVLHLTAKHSFEKVCYPMCKIKEPCDVYTEELAEFFEKYKKGDTNLQ